MTFDDERSRVLSLPYECLESLPGGMSEVRRWYDPLLDCERVGKRVDLLGIDESVVPEAATLQLVDHPNVVKVVTAAQVGGYPSPMNVIEIVTPYYPMGSLTDALLRGEVFTASEAVSIVRTALLGLEHLHEVHNLCHRDVKSGNILLGGRATGLVADIGLAGAMDQHGSVVSLENPTLYTPSEFGSSGRVGRPGDVYSMGLVLREAIGGHFDYDTYTRADVIRRITAGSPVIRAAELELPVWASSSLLRVYRRAIHRDPAKRYPTARDFEASLARAKIADFKEVDDMKWQKAASRSAPAVEVSARMVRGELRLTLKVDRGSGYRRYQPEVATSSLRSVEARRVFDSATTI